MVSSGKYNEAVTAYDGALKIKSGTELQSKIDKIIILAKSSDALNTGVNVFKTKIM
ncbi:hypothetical protein LL037_21505 [Clostridium estertheticum]|uniref:hypothetical protein n=1 Tax=Clostridium estertheticum TaxID=238834 RepID=UPI001C0C9E99|nr:hypothetical protein [Clostridium estertheticum]MBU3198320.1 hypothetical protein [Clostridium estertheticum]WAG65007.1 hypothetical protein LL037_21505 [Clostridium estertheticum]